MQQSEVGDKQSSSPYLAQVAGFKFVMPVELVEFHKTLQSSPITNTVPIRKMAWGLDEYKTYLVEKIINSSTDQYMELIQHVIGVLEADVEAGRPIKETTLYVRKSAVWNKPLRQDERVCVLPEIFTPVFWTACGEGLRVVLSAFFNRLVEVTLDTDCFSIKIHWGTSVNYVGHHD